MIHFGLFKTTFEVRWVDHSMDYGYFKTSRSGGHVIKFVLENSYLAWEIPRSLEIS